MESTARYHEHIEDCIRSAQHCHDVCLRSAMDHCLHAGEAHVEPEQYCLLMNCVDICQLTANFQTGRSRFSAQLCGLCAEICETAARSCAQIDGMAHCAQACADCAQACRRAGGVHDVNCGYGAA